ncbi:glycosyltransferase family 49 protein [Peniophora sp. CONT]|nr:glycosyltransferase family 49 protein [Peniophora sp. CONT]
MAYTTTFLLLCPFVRDCPSALSLRRISPHLLVTRPARAHTHVSALYEAPSAVLARVTGNSSAANSPTLQWGTATLSEQLFLSKAFADALQPLHAQPYFHRALNVPAQHDITLATLVTPDRYAVLARLAERYKGPLSVAVHITHPAPLGSRPTAEEQLAALQDLIKSSRALRERADIHLLVSPFPRALNAWRNAARLFARSQLVLLLDADFVPPPAFPASSLLSTLDPTLAQRVTEGTAALVLPAFEYTLQSDGADASKFPKAKSELMKEVKKGKISMFHKTWAPGHNCTDYDRYGKAKTGEVYEVTTYTSAYEPYVIVARDAGGWCDERFTGYGGNKAACLYELHLSGATFFVLADQFVIHQSHAYEEQARKSERKYNRKIYADFREEACLRHVRALGAEGMLSSPRAQNAMRECSKLRGVRALLGQLEATYM